MRNSSIETWKFNIYQSLKDISDLENQKLSWLGKHPVEVSSYTEVLGMLYDTFAFEDYIEFYKSNNGETKLYRLMIELCRMIDKYQEIGYQFETEKGGAERILNDSRWVEITDKSVDILKNWD